MPRAHFHLGQVGDVKEVKEMRRRRQFILD